jgi:predicted dehydrogenase
MATGDEVSVNRAGKGTLFRLVGTAGLIEFWGWESAYRIVDADHPSGEDVSVEPGPRSRHQLHLERLADQMDGSAADYAVAESSLQALELVEAAYLSARHGCQVWLPLRDFQAPPRGEWVPGQPYEGLGGGRDGRKLESR